MEEVAGSIPARSTNFSLSCVAKRAQPRRGGFPLGPETSSNILPLCPPFTSYEVNPVKGTTLAAPINRNFA
jgi:hypothetical protein